MSREMHVPAPPLVVHSRDRCGRTTSRSSRGGRCARPRPRRRSSTSRRTPSNARARARSRATSRWCKRLVAGAPGERRLSHYGCEGRCNRHDRCLTELPPRYPRRKTLRSATERTEGLLRCPRIAGRGDQIPGVRCLSRFWPLPDALLTTTTRPGHRCRSRCRSRRSAVELGRSPHATPHRACVDRRGATASAPIYMAPGSRCRQRAEAARLLRASPLPGVVLRQGYSPKPPIWRHSTKSTRQLLATSAPPGRSSSKVNRYAVVCVTRFEVCVPDGAPRSNVASIMPFEKVVEIGSP